MSTAASTRSGGRAAAAASVGGEAKLEEEQDDDEVYQYPRAGLGPVFASIESLLRCAICGGLSDPPVSLPCCQQTFCSLCIRQYLDSTTPRCPCCRAASASNQLLMCKELRTICTLWKRNRQAILAAADASSEAATTGGAEAAAAAAAASAAIDSVPSGRRRVCAVGAGQGRDGGGGKMAKLYYHQLTDKSLKQKLLDVGLPVGGGRAAMIARHKRLALLDAASSDREVPVPRRELIRQVTSWEREKEKEKQAAARSGAGGILSASVSASATVSLGQPAQSTEGPGDGSLPPEAEKIVIPKKMQAGFSALIANARKNAKKRPSSSSGSEAGNGSATAAGADRSGSKRARVSQAPGGGSSGGGGAVICNSSGAARPYRSDGAGGKGSVISGGAAVANGGGAEMRILGVAGRMVRTRGPWRCVLSNGRARLPLAATAAAAAAAAAPSVNGDAEDKQKFDTPTGVTISAEAVDCQGGNGSIMSTNGRADAVASSGNGLGGGGAGVSGGECGGGGSNNDSSASVGSEETDVVPAEALREGGLVYLNTATGDTVREPPAELVTRAEEADSAGDYLVFIPSRSFVEAAEAAAGLSEAASAVGAAAENVLQAVVDARTSSAASIKASGGGGGERRTEAPKWPGGEEGPQQRASRLPSLEAPTPPTAAKPAAAAASASGGSCHSAGDGRGAAGGGETWDRFSSLRMIDLSQGAPPVPLDVESAVAVAGGTGAARPEAAVAVEGAAGAAAAMWTCTACTLLNKARRTKCAACANARPKSFETQQERAVQPASSSRSKLRLLQRRSSGSVPQSSITSFTSRPPSDASEDNGRSKTSGGSCGGGGDVQLVSPQSSAAPMPAAGAGPSSQPPPPSSQTSATAPISVFPTVRSQDRSSSDVYATAPPEKLQQ